MHFQCGPYVIAATLRQPSTADHLNVGANALWARPHGEVESLPIAQDLGSRLKMGERSGRTLVDSGGCLRFHLDRC